MDNIYNYANFCKDALNHPKYFMVLAVMRKRIHVIPACMIYNGCTTPIDAAWDRVTMKADIMKNEPK